MNNPTDLTDQFANEMGLSVDLLSCKKPSSLAPQDRHCIYHPSINKNISNLLITQGGAFSNSLTQLTNAINLALKLNVENIYLARSYRHPPDVHPPENGHPFWYLKPGRYQYATGKFIINEDFDRASLVGVTIAGEFSVMDAFLPLLDCYYPFAALSLKHFFSINFNKYEFSEKDLVLYVRSGTVFVPNPNCGYSQPPLCFYKLIVDSKKWDSFTVVYEDTVNPVIIPLIEYCKTKGPPVRLICGDLRDDIEVLLSAKVLTMSRGTFTSGVVSISENAQVVYDFSGSYTGLRKRSDISIIDVIDTKNTYIDAIYNLNWVGSDEQRRMMVDYSHVGFAHELGIKLSWED